MYMYMYVCTHTGMNAYVHACVRTRSRAHVHAWMHTYIGAINTHNGDISRSAGHAPAQAKTITIRHFVHTST